MNPFLDPWSRETDTLANYNRVQLLLRQIDISTQILNIYLKQYETKKNIPKQAILSNIITESQKLTRLISELRTINQPSPGSIPIIISGTETIARQILHRCQALLLQANLADIECLKAH